MKEKPASTLPGIIESEAESEDLSKSPEKHPSHKDKVPTKEGTPSFRERIALSIKTDDYSRDRLKGKPQTEEVIEDPESFKN